MDLTIPEILDRYKDHQSIVNIRFQMNHGKNLFSFNPVTYEKILKPTNLLKTTRRRYVGLKLLRSLVVPISLLFKKNWFTPLLIIAFQMN